MELIVAVYDDWGIGCEGTQPIALSVDRKFFREMTKGALVIAGRKTVGDFPGGKPLPGRINVVLSRSELDLPGFTVVNSPEQALELAKAAEKAMVIGGGSIYKLMMPYCDTAIITKVHCTCPCDTYLTNLDEDPDWYVEKCLQSSEENGIGYEMLVYKRK